MPIFATLSSAAVRHAPRCTSGPARDVRRALPMRFEAVGEALVSERGRHRAVRGGGPRPGPRRCRPGRGTLRAADDLRSWCSARGPTFEAAEALSRRLERRDARLPPRPLLRGPADRAGQPGPPAHPARRDLPRGRAHRRRSPAATRWSSSSCRFRGPTGVPGHHFTRALRLVQVTEADAGGLRRRPRRSAGSGPTGPWSLVAARPSTSAPRWRCCATSLDDLDLGEADVRVWIEGLPADRPAAASRLLDELARLTRLAPLGWPHVRPLRLEPAARGPRRGVRDRRGRRSPEPSSPTTTSRRPRRSTPSSSGRRATRRATEPPPSASCGC